MSTNTESRGKQVTLSCGRVIQVREPRVRDLMAVDDIKSEQQKEIKMLSSLTQLTGDELMEMRIPDYKRLQEAVQDFFG